MKISIALLILMMMNVALSKDTCVTVDHGTVSVSEECECTVKNNGELITNYDRLYFGIIQYSCSGNDGYIISKLSCVSCGMYCVKNDLIVECQNTVFQMSVGVLVGTLIGSLLMYILKRPLQYLVKKLMVRWFIRKQHKADLKANKRSNFISEVTKTEARPVYKNKYRFGEKSRKLSNKHRNLHQEAAGYVEMGRRARTTGMTLGEVNEMDNVMTESEAIVELERMNEPEEITDEWSTQGVPLSSTRLACVPLVIVMLALLPLGETCDMAFYFRNDGKICSKDKCNEINMYNFPIGYGKTVCFRDSADQITEFKVTQSYNRLKYDKVYYTGTPIVKTESNWKCEGTALCSKKECRLGAKFHDFMSYGNDQFSCETSASPCDNYCMWSSQCVYTHYWLEMPSKLYPVFELESSIWEIEVTSTKNGIVTRSSLNVNNPTVNMFALSDEVIMKMPMFVSNVESEETIKSSTGVLIDDNFYPVHASDINLPVGGQIGELQVDIYKKNMAMDPTLVQCQVDNCEYTCRTSGRSMERLVNGSMNYPSKKVSRTLNSGSTIEIKSEIRPSIMVTIGNVNFENLFVRQSKCKLRVMSTYGCYGCSQPSYAVIQAYAIESEGILDYESNCTFDRPYISCNSEPYTLKLDQNYNYCRLDVPMLNTTLSIDMSYKFLGEISKVEYSANSESYTGILKSIATSDSFIKSITNTITACSIMSTVIVIGMQAARVYGAHRLEEAAMNTH